MYHMLYRCSSLEQLNLYNLNTFFRMFIVKKINVSCFNTRNIVDMNHMF